MMFPRRIFSLALLFIVMAIFFFVGCQKKIAPVAQRQVNKIVFLSNRDAQKREFDIFSMNRDGSDPVNLTKNIPGVRAFSKPCVSHDGKTLIFLTFQPPVRTLYSMQMGDSVAVPLTQLKHDNPQVCFSPDDRYIVFVDLVEGRHQIFHMNRDGSNRRNLSQNKFDDTDPDYSPDGKKICFTTKRGKTESIAIMNADGSGQSILTDDKGDDFNPSFSPEGDKIVFSSRRKGISDIYLLALSSRKIFALFANKSYDIEPQFSPDGKQVLFISNARGIQYRDLMLIDLKSKKVRNLTESLNHFNQNPLFSPDGKSILFESIRFEDAEICQIGIDGKNFKNLTNHPQWDLAPTW
ncbi:MAG: hypothetical protein GXO74_12090 [Calditrichaeota bacterium]|nr:hypothetical protein [Calditrichota bacterium]